ncbi:proprotein convertase P-domain-containing protein [Streptomyces sp. NPDC046881]|uniref:proprotein convertase P-domain-containing protein n=1 Tax=Streptomyces sp. NPDC046881 TaxID=3155374 RepID=UPI0033FD1164
MRRSALPAGAAPGIWTAVVAAVTTVALGAVPAHAATPPSAPAAAGTAATANGPVDPPLYDETADGGSVRVNVVTGNRTDLSSAAAAGETVQSFTTLPVVTLKVTRSGLDKLAAQPGVVSVTEDTPVRPSLDQSVPLIGGDIAAAKGLTGAGSAIAVLDTGVATNHPFLKGRIVSEACFSPIDADYSATSLCPNGTAQQEGTGTADSGSGPCATLADCDHGTHVAGIAAGNGKGLTGGPKSGVAPGAGIVAIQVFSKFASEDFCGPGAAPCVLSFTSAQLAALEKVRQLKLAGTPIVAANLSLGGGRYATACENDPRKLAIDNLFDAGVTTVVAAGNNGYGDAVSAPACVSSALAVGSTTDDDQLSSFTNRGPLLDVFAPGTGIVSSVPGGGYASKNGTSMAAPHVSGALAVLRQAFPDKSTASLESLLKATGKSISYTGATTPRIDLGKAVGTTQPDPVTAPRPTKILNDTDFAVPDPGTVESPITVAGIPGSAPKALQVSVELTHEWLGDVKIDLIAPDGRTYPLKATSASESGGTLARTYPVDASASPANGTWKLRAEDRSTGAAGTLKGWSLTFPTPFAKSGSFAVPDPGTLTSDITVSGMSGKASGALQVAVELTHEWLGEVRIDLVAPDGRSYPLKATNGTDPGGTLARTYTVDASASTADGTWKLLVEDRSAGGVGALKSWSLTFPSYRNETTYALPDPGTVTSPITVAGLSGSAPKALQVSVGVTHEWLGDVKIDLIAPDGRTYPLKATSASESGGTLTRTYPVDASASPANGTWKLQVADGYADGIGTLDTWSLTF